MQYLQCAGWLEAVCIDGRVWLDYQLCAACAWTWWRFVLRGLWCCARQEMKVTAFRRHRQTPTHLLDITEMSHQERSHQQETASRMQRQVWRWISCACSSCQTNPRGGVSRYTRGTRRPSGLLTNSFGDVWLVVSCFFAHWFHVFFWVCLVVDLIFNRRDARFELLVDLD